MKHDFDVFGLDLCVGAMVKAQRVSCSDGSRRTCFLVSSKGVDVLRSLLPASEYRSM